MSLILDLREHRGERTTMAYTPRRRLWVANDGSIVEEGDPSAASLLTVPGRPVTDSVAEQYSLADVEARLDRDIGDSSTGTPQLKQATKVDEPEDDPDPEGNESEAKAKEPVEDKAVKPNKAKKAATRRRSRRVAAKT